MEPKMLLRTVLVVAAVHAGLRPHRRGKYTYWA